MYYEKAQQSIEEYFKLNWLSTSVQYDNVGFVSDLYEEFVKLSVIFGEGQLRSLGQRSYRQIGVTMVSMFVRSGTGTSRMNELGTAVTELLSSLQLQPVAPLQAPVLQFKIPTFNRNLTERDGWVMATVTCPFYYDLEM